jgi:hypothetical protein
VKNQNSLVHAGLACLLIAGLVSPIRADLTLNSGYDEPADLFVLMDNVSWWSSGGFLDRPYRDYWESQYTVTAEDQAWFDRYAEYRRRTYSDPGQAFQDPREGPDGYFAKRSSMAPESDPLAHHMIGSGSIDAALETLPQAVGEADAQTLRGFYRHFEDQWRPILAESAAFAERATALNATLSGPEVQRYVDRLTGFFNVELDRDFGVYFVWWPPIDRTAAGITGSAFVIKSHPQRHANEDGWEGIAMHELVHFISAHQSSDQKRTLTDQFLEICPADSSASLYDIIEEPLAVAWGNAAFGKFVMDSPLHPAESWYFRPLPATMGRLIWPLVDRIYKSDTRITDGFIPHAAMMCRRLLEAGELMIRLQDR